VRKPKTPEEEDDLLLLYTMWVENFKRVKAFISVFVSLFGHDWHEQTNDFGTVVGGGGEQQHSVTTQQPRWIGY
jgi:hypothetical protein